MCADAMAAAEMLERLLVNDAARTHDGDVVAGVFHLREHVRREDHRAARRTGLEHEFQHLGPGRRVEIRRRFVEDHQRRLHREHDGQRQFLPHPRAHAGHLPGAVEIEPPGHARGHVAAAAGPQTGKEIEHAMAVHAAEEPCLAGQIGRAGPHLQRLPHAVETGHRRRSRRGRDVAHQQSQQRGLACAVGPEQSEDRPFRHRQRTAVERGEAAVAFGEVCGADDHCGSLPKKGATKKRCQPPKLEKMPNCPNLVAGTFFRKARNNRRPARIR